ncbi:conserved hypothetical protein [Hyella patelloides LEGE 07179]|uniref:Nucleotidyl transferase AbiEii/AbiGii toxin family protein n=1 Tax=Hyella patelloides LEGE 07179 TaxID=945734 RepID=A0A563VSL1_9CYAN|nr:nucleotidyl transferase AbiEii/AbiGii toxin family protein [Hyella patelloides]VEP14279.1 conserved hypothetical protein [Hyella patelloides LEGE 07179]
MLLNPPQNLPFLSAICWQIDDIYRLLPKEMLQIYERNWRYCGILATPSTEEISFIKQLCHYYNSDLIINNLSMFKREFHRLILTVLSTFNAKYLLDYGAYFGGGTLFSLDYGEYRLSKDIDCICGVGEGYRQLRQQIYSLGYDALFSDTKEIELPQAIKSDQYGIRFPVLIKNTIIKIEIVAEGRIALEQPEYPNWSPVPCLNFKDRIAEKLLANSDRWLDNSVKSRDLIDLAIARIHSPFPEEAFHKAEQAYPVIEPLKEAIINFQAKPEYREECFSILQIDNPAQVINGLDLLAQDFNFDTTERTFPETNYDYLDN